jgi:hypothetical protein
MAKAFVTANATTQRAKCLELLQMLDEEHAAELTQLLE